MYRQGLILALEDADVNLEGGELPPEEAAEVAATVADDSSAVQAEGDEAAVTVAQVEDAVQGGEELEDIAEVASDAVESGEGLDEDAAEVAAIAVESIRARLGFPRGRTLPATESFGQTSTRLASTKLVIESIGDTIKQIWAAIKAAALRMWEKIKSFIGKILQSTSMLTKLLNDLKARADKVPASAKKKEENLKHSGVARSFSIGGKADKSTALIVVQNTSKLSGELTTLLDAAGGVAAAAGQLASSKLDEAAVKAFLNAEDGGAKRIYGSINGAFKEVTGKFSAGQQDKTDGDSTTKFYGPFIGHQVLSVKTTAGKDGKAGSIVVDFTKSTETAASEIKALELSEIKEIVNQGLAAVKGLENFKKALGPAEAISKGYAKVSDTIMSNVDKLLEQNEVSTETREALKELKESAQSGLRTFGSLSQRAPSLVYQSINSLADYASISLRNLSTEAK